MEKYIQISSGRGPQECNLAVQHCLKTLTNEAIKHNLSIEVLKKEKDNGGVCSVILKIVGNEASSFTQSWIGTIQWISKSPIRPQHKRKNWFIGIFEVQKITNVELDEKQIKFESMRSAGPGGQHVNKVSSAVRATYLPYELSVQVMESRSQLENKKIAITRLKSKLKEVQNQTNTRKEFGNWIGHLQIERGNPIRTFVGLKFTKQ